MALLCKMFLKQDFFLLFMSKHQSLVNHVLQNIFKAYQHRPIEPLKLTSGGGALYTQRLGFYFLAQINPAYRKAIFYKSLHM